GRLYSPFPWWRFARALSRHCAGLTLYVPFKKVDDPGEAYLVDLGEMKLAVRPFYRRFCDYYLGLPYWWRGLRRRARELVREHDLVIGRMPGPATKRVAKAAVAAGKPVALFVAGDLLAGSYWDARTSLLRRSVGRVLGAMLRRDENWVARHAAFVGVWD